MAERVRITGKNDGVNNNEAIDAQVDNNFNALHVKSHLYGYDGIGFGNPVEVNSDGQLHVVMEGKVDSGNSTDTPLLADAVYTGTACNVLAYAGLTILVGSNVAGTLLVQYGPDGSDWHDGESYDILAGANKFFTPPVQSAYYRIVYTNGDTDQTTFFIHSVLKKQAVKWSGHNIDSPIVDQDDAELVKAVITGKRVDGIFANANLTNGNNLKISLEELENGISSNSNSQLNVTPFHADGTEGNLITGIDYVSGKSGIDAATETLQTIEYEHHEIHSGSHYFVVGYQDLAINNVLQFTWQMPDTTKWIHWIWNIITESETLWQIYEGGTITTPLTTLATPYNNNRNSANTSDTVMRYEKHTNLAAANTKVTPSALVLEAGISGAGKDLGASVRSSELVMKQNTLYVLRATATAAGYINFNMQWYEHTNKN
jgi:hypothetical protein